MKVSIVTVCYNAADLIERTLESVCNQTYKDVEYIIIDGGSTDATLDIINKYKNKISYFISEPDKGIFDAMNKGAKAATGDFINFMNAGDYFYSNDTIEKVVKKIDGENVYYGDVINYSENHQNDFRDGGSYNKYRLTLKPYFHQSMFYPKDVFKKFKYNQRYRISGDSALNIKLNKYYHFSYLEIPVAFYLMGGRSSANDDYLYRRNYRFLVLKYLGLLPFIYNIFKSLQRLPFKLLRIKKNWNY